MTAVILTRDGASILDECLASINRHTQAGLTGIVIVDHQSTDDTQSVVRKWQADLPITYEYVPGNNSFSFANNRAICEHADTDYVLLLNNDIILIEDVVGRMVRYLDEHADVGLVGCKLLEARDRRDLTNARVHHLGIQLELGQGGIRVIEVTRPAFVADLVAELPTYSVTGACAMMRRTDYLAVGGLAESYFYGGEDVELGEAVWADLGKKVVCLNGVSALHHRGWLRLSARGEGLDRIERNAEAMQHRIGYQMRKRHARGLLDPEARWATQPARFGFVVLDSGVAARTAESAPALELGSAIAARYGVEVEFIEPASGWYDAEGLTHIVNLLPGYRISELRGRRPDLFRIAWLIGDFDHWIAAGELDRYQMVWCASAAFCRDLAEHHGIRALHVPLAANLAAMAGSEDRESVLRAFAGEERRAETVGDALVAASDTLHSVAVRVGASNRRSPGDAALADALAKSLRARGLYARVLPADEPDGADEMFDAAIILRGGSPYSARPDELSLAWIVSDPDNLSAHEIAGYDAVAFASRTLAENYAATTTSGTLARPFAAISNGRVATALPAGIGEGDIVFIGDCLDHRRDFIVEIAKTLPIKAIGRGWDQYLPMDMVVSAPAADPSPALYAAAFAVLHEHQPDMVRAGMLPTAVLDIIAAGGLAISDWNEEGAALLGRDIFFRSPADAVAALRGFRDAPDERRATIERSQQNLASHFIPQVTADRIHDLLLQAHEDRMRGSRRGHISEAPGLAGRQHGLRSHGQRGTM